MISVEELDKVLEEIEAFIELIYSDEKKGFEILADVISTVQMVMGEFLGLVPALNEAGMDIPLEVLEQQIIKLGTVIEHRDTVGIIDSLRYEIEDSIKVYQEIVAAIGEE